MVYAQSIKIDRPLTKCAVIGSRRGSLAQSDLRYALEHTLCK